MSAPNLTATDGGVYVALADTTQVFPATIEDERWNGFAVPRFRRIVAESIALWLNTMHDHGPDEWPDTATFDGDVLTVLETEEHRPDRVGRNGAWLSLVGSVHWKMLADLLGVADTTASAWHRENGGDRASYVASRLRQGQDMAGPE
ncbi:hypothetical protein DI005_22160 [Prauserella sp. PE36]|uniref:hypothetical protein n=1 Tax=Prauserella sp. PE36 TaxID=1504709 RepID=UPI000DE46AB9|nr:hypothetical protein [Prauserella sp. PE36]RBM17397.1 hypothetical protein DI005_22160 [Prauserella sp. PE36]